MHRSEIILISEAVCCQGYQATLGGYPDYVVLGRNGSGSSGSTGCIIL